MYRIMDYAAEKAPVCIANDKIPDELFKQYGVNRGLRDIKGKGVLTGLTRISKMVSFAEKDGVLQPCEGELWYRGYNIRDLVAMTEKQGFGFERTAYLLIFGEMPDEKQAAEFSAMIGECRTLPTNFTRDVIMKAPSKDIMNSMTRSILTLASYDDDMQNNDIANSLRQCIMLISIFPQLAVYAYHAYNHYENNDSMYIHRPNPALSTAENLLMMLRPDKSYTELEARVLDIALLLHMEHGGGNNSTFTTRVVTSSGSDTYSTIAAAMSSLKGAKHGGANIKVMEMIDNIRENVGDITDKDAVYAYLGKILDGEAFDRKGLIYGMGHAVYSLSDPRERIFRGYVEQLAQAKGRNDELSLYEFIEEAAPKLIAEKRSIMKGVSPNVDFYSGFVYDMLGIPRELYTAFFAIARIVGWSAHRIEELVSAGKIIRPAYKSVMDEISTK
ncbi:MAG: citrate/2-methylcitrate synthase [Oscillospiraceae bacterium]